MRERLGVWACALSILAVGGWMMVGAHTPEPSPFTVAVSAASPADVMVPGTARPVVVLPSADALKPAAAGRGPVSLETRNAVFVSPGWVRDTAAATLIPERALLGYAGAALRIAAEAPSCRLGWTTLAALGAIESGHGDGVMDPQQIDDAALAAGHYLCHYGDLSQPAGWRAAVFAYNHVDSYVDSVAATANAYAARAG